MSMVLQSFRYGEVEFGEYVIDGYKVLFRKVDGDRILYRRFSGEKVVLERIVFGYEKIMFIPVYPALTPKHVTNYLLLEFKTPVHIAPGSITYVYVEIPIDIAIYIYRDKVFTVLDIISLMEPKYTLYGDPFNGLIARYYSTSIHYEITPIRGRALAKLTLRNRTNEWVVVTKLLVDMNSLKIFYKPRTIEAYTQELLMIIDSPSTASVGYGDPFVSDIVPIDDPPELRQPRIMLKTDMLWGI